MVKNLKRKERDEHESDSDEEIDIAGNLVADGSDSESDDSSDGSDEEVQDVIEYSSDEEEPAKPAKAVKKKVEDKSFPSLELSDDEDEKKKVDNDDDDVNAYFSVNTDAKSKHKKGSFASFGLSKLILV